MIIICSQCDLFTEQCLSHLLFPGLFEDFSYLSHTFWEKKIETNEIVPDSDAYQNMSQQQQSNYKISQCKPNILLIVTY